MLYVCVIIFRETRLQQDPCVITLYTITLCMIILGEGRLVNSPAAGSIRDYIMHNYIMHDYTRRRSARKLACGRIHV